MGVSYFSGLSINIYIYIYIHMYSILIFIVKYRWGYWICF